MVYIFLAEGFEDVEALTVVDLTRRAGIEIKIISVSSDDSIFLMLSALHRLFKFLAPQNGIETIRYEYDACDCYEILEDLIQSENEDVSQEAERLLHEIYDVE